MIASFRMHIIFTMSAFLVVFAIAQARAQSVEAGRYYRLTTMWRGEGMSLDIVNDGTNNRPVLAVSAHVAGQYWKLTQQPNGYYRLTTQWRGDGMSLDVVNDGENNKPVLAASADVSGQYWKLTPQAGGYYRLTTMWRGEGMSLDIVNDGANNTPILAPAANASGQLWKLTPAEQAVVQPPAAEIRPPLPYSAGGYAIAHMTNTSNALNWAQQQGANAVEIDLNFDASGQPVRFYHGGFCDCSCGTAGVCNYLSGGCEASEPADQLLKHLATLPFSLVILDSKVGDLPADALAKAGVRAVDLLQKNLFSNGFKGQVIIGVPDIDHYAYLSAAASAAEATPDRNFYFFSIDQEGNDAGGVLNKLAGLGTPNRVFGTGISACVPGSYDAGIRAGVANERAEASALTYIWTLDKQSSMESYIDLGARGVITNNPAAAISAFQGRGLSLVPVGAGMKRPPNNTIDASCDCSYRNPNGIFSGGGCTIVDAAPRNAACNCYMAGAWTCGGELTACKNASAAKCLRPDQSKDACLQGGGDCGGY